MTNIVIVDIDGTLSDASERAEKYLSKEPKDWDKFYDACGSDKPIQEIVDLVCALSDSYGTRPKWIRNGKITWLSKRISGKMSRWVDTDKQSLVESIKWAAKQIESKRGFIPPKYVFCSNDVEHEKRIKHLKEQGYVQISENVWKLP